MRAGQGVPLPGAQDATTAYGSESGPRQATVSIRLLIVDDHAVMRSALARLLGNEPGIEVVGEGRDGVEAIGLATALRPDVILMDANMPRMGGVEATRRIVACCPAIKVIGLSMHDRDTMAPLMRKVGAVAYVAKSAPLPALIAAVRETGAGVGG